MIDKEECCNQNCNQGRDCPLGNKELTNAEIEKVFWEIANKKIDNPVMEFARAILRKAQEK
jgi:hypothetical protein